MVRAQGVIPVLMATGVTVAVLAACGSPGCGSGADSATEAVSGMLRAAEGGSREEVCRFVPSDQTEQAISLYSSLRPALQRAGGVERLSLADQPSRRMGGEHVITAHASGVLVAEFVVGENSGRFILYPEARATAP